MLNLILPAIAVGATILGGAAQARSARAQGREAQRQAAFNAQMAEYAARDAERRGQERAAAIEREARALRSEQRAATAANGLTVGYGTAGQIDAQTDFFAKLDANTALDDAARDAWTARTQGAEALRGGAAARKQARYARSAVLLNTAATLADRWMLMRGGQ